MDCTPVVAKVKGSIALVIARGSSKDKDGNKEVATGTGFVFSKPGIIVTCNHVVKDSGLLLLKFPDKEEFLACKAILRDEEHDLALLKFDDVARVPLPVGDLDKVKEGMEVIFSGYPLSSFNLTTHHGVLSAIIKDQTGVTSYLIDGTVNSGNSGCPLMDSNGKVIGVVNAKRRVSNDLLQKVENMSLGAVSLHGVDIVEIYQALINNVQLGVGYAVPANYIPEHKEIVQKKKNGK